MCAWSVPRTWAVNELVTAANMNLYISDDLQYLYDNRNDITNYGVSPLTARSTGDLALTASFADVTGVTVTLGGPGEFIIAAFLHASTDTTAALRTITGRLLVNDVEQSGYILLTTAQDVDAMVGNAWFYDAGSSGLVAKIQAKHSGQANTAKATNTMITAIQASAP